MSKERKINEEITGLLRQGFAALQAGKPREAAAFCKRALDIDPAQLESHFLVGLVALDLADLPAAARAFGAVVKIDPDHAAGWAQLARIFMRIGQPVRAEAARDEAIRAGVEHAPVADLVGVVSSLLGDQKQARRWYSLAVAKAPESDEFAVNLATACVYLGDNAAARDILGRVLARNERVAQAQWLYSSIVKAEGDGRARDLQRRAAAADPQSAALLNYAAGKEFEDCGAWDEAFAAFAAGARLKRSLVDFDEPAEIALFDALTATFTPEWAKSLRPGSADPSPIFVIGQPRTGTTLIERIITSHSLVESAGELQQFGLSVRRLSHEAGGGDLAARSVAHWASIDPARLGAEYLRASTPMREGAPRFVDKLPNNFLYAPLILAALPQARIVHVVRDPMDACFASYKQLFAEAYLHSYDQEEMARHYARYFRLMAHWRRVFPGRILDVSYEAVVSDLEPEARRLIDFLGLDFEAACLDFHEQESAVATASAAQVREKAHTRSVGRWRRHEKHLGAMRAALVREGVIDA